MTVRLLTAEEVDRGELNAFLTRSFSPCKSAFLCNHGDWWSRGANHRWALAEEGRIIGYSAVIPNRIRVGREIVDVVWWVDLVIDPDCRGRKLQRLFDERVRQHPIVLGFPNAAAARIHKRHGWGVREDLRVRLEPLRPSELPALSRLPRVSRPFVGSLLWLLRSANRRRRTATDTDLRPLDGAAISEMARLAEAIPSEWATTNRDEQYLRWRYLEAPWLEELTYLRSKGVAMVVRSAKAFGAVVARGLDMVGHLEGEGVEGIVAAASQHARAVGAVQFSALASCPAIDRSLRRAGLFLRSRGRSCWHSTLGQIEAEMDRSYHYWTLGDADHDEP